MPLKPYLAHYNWDSEVAGVAMRAVAGWPLVVREQNMVDRENGGAYQGGRDSFVD